jgi:hypothetical protein
MSTTEVHNAGRDAADRGHHEEASQWSIWSR